uniref:hypothetical protein n=1 Tax=Phaeodactylibacter xiamenensis TaxID=1524460 RepID=UPI0024A82814
CCAFWNTSGQPSRRNWKLESIDVLLFRDGNINKSNGLQNKSRENESYERNYIKGKYGAIPFLGDFNLGF